MGKKEILNILESMKLDVSAKYGVTKIGLFGSGARDSMNEESDIDICVELSKADLFALVHLKEYMEANFGKKVDIVHYRPTMNKYLKKCIDKEAVYV